MKLVKVFAVVVVACLLALMGFIYSGQYNIGADAPHWPFSGRLLEMLREQSIAAHAGGIEVPDLKDPELIGEGAIHYAPMCSGCHLAPGMENTELRAGLYPQPRNLAEARVAVANGDADRIAARQFWIIKHGIKMSAMPSWGATHDDISLWAIVAFLHRLPELSPAQYQTMIATESGHSHGDTGHDHSAHQSVTDQPPASGPAHEHDESSDTHGVEPDRHDHGTEEGHAHGHEESEQPHSH